MPCPRLMPSLRQLPRALAFGLLPALAALPGVPVLAQSATVTIPNLLHEFARSGPNWRRVGFPTRTEGEWSCDIGGRNVLLRVVHEVRATDACPRAPQTCRLQVIGRTTRYFLRDPAPGGLGPGRWVEPSYGLTTFDPATLGGQSYPNGYMDLRLPPRFNMIVTFLNRNLRLFPNDPQRSGFALETGMVGRVTLDGQSAVVACRRNDTEQLRRMAAQP